MDEVRTVNIIDNEVCPFCRKELRLFWARLAIYKLGTDYPHQFISAGLLFCEECRIYYATELLKKDLEKQAYPLIVKENKNLIKEKISFFPNIIDYNLKSNDDYKTIIKGDNFYNNLNQESELKKLGYQITGMTADDRWKVLISRAIPKLGLEKTISIIENNIHLREQQKNGSIKYSNAIGIWRYDIKRLKEYYNY